MFEWCHWDLFKAQSVLFSPSDWVENMLQEWWEFLKSTEIVNSMVWILCSVLAAHGHTGLCVNFCLPRGAGGKGKAESQWKFSSNGKNSSQCRQSVTPTESSKQISSGAYSCSQMTFGITWDLTSQRQKGKRKTFSKINRISITATGRKRNNLRNPVSCSGVLLGLADGP